MLCDLQSGIFAQAIDYRNLYPRDIAFFNWDESDIERSLNVEIAFIVPKIELIACVCQSKLMQPLKQLMS
ncbi:hypothetical protein NIES593_14545 [Hydrococcus rivularis NIES-593]|uniref:Uncharacterized protein n=1 Tax=Hydrococcus rivularis NIES-593 TaxID=1921803 RepID=A0A1U7HE54_9CYAN|nr:hypothetical protein [Hydrococcus rivularis]OKH21882.1 hypothetical protein NIES593_14545 [Hydrococcus rivularis NIES-593]